MAGNSFGELFRFTTWGESHGVAIGCVVDGVPPLLPLVEPDLQHWLDRRRPGGSRFVTQRREPDAVRILSGVFEDEEGRQITTGTPIALQIENVDARSKDYGDIKDKFRPGHADYTYFLKYGVRDWRGSGRASARETATRVAAGAIARKVVPGLRVRGALVQIGPHQVRLEYYSHRGGLAHRPAVPSLRLSVVSGSPRSVTIIGASRNRCSFVRRRACLLTLPERTRTLPMSAHRAPLGHGLRGEADSEAASSSCRLRESRS